MKKIRVLYIEDEAKQRREITRRLRGKSFIVIPAATGQTGLKLFLQRPVDIVLCDLNMPRMGGLTVLKRIRRLDPNLPVIILTAHGSTGLAVKTVKQGAFNFVLKPLAIEEITASIKQAIEHAELQKRLAHSEAELQGIIENVPDILYSFDAQGRFLRVSPAVRTILGHRPADVIGRSVFAYIHPDDRVTFREALAQVRKRRPPAVRTFQVRLLTKNGESRNFEISRRVVVEKGEIIRFDGIARDITERIQLEEKLREYSSGLEQKVAERTERAAYANRQLAALNNVSNRLTRLHDEEKLLDEVPKLLTTSLDFDRATLFLAVENELQLRAAYFPKDPPEMQQRFIRRAASYKIKLPPHFMDSLRENKTIHIDDLNVAPHWPKQSTEPIRTKAIVITPIRVGGKPIGVIGGNLQHHERVMDQQDIARFEMFANMIGLAITNARAYRSLEQKVEDKTKSLREKARQLENSAIELGMANVELLGAHEKLAERNAEMENLLGELSQNRDKLQAILDSSPSAIIMIDPEGVIQAASRLCAGHFKLDPDKIIGSRYSTIIKKIRRRVKDTAKFDTLVSRLAECVDKPGVETPTELYQRAIQLVGPTARFISIYCVPVLDDAGVELGRAWIFADITKFKQADEQLRILVEASPVPSIITRISDGLIIYANDRLGELIGTTKEDLIGRISPDFYYDPHDRLEVVRILQRDGILPQMEVRIKRIDGTPIWTIFSLAATELGGEQVVIGSLYDITKRKEAEEQLAATQALLRAAIEQSPSGIVVADAATGEIRLVNPAALAIRGVTDAKLVDIDVSRHAVNWQTYHADGTPYAPEDLPLSRAILNGEVSREKELIIRRESGEDRWISTNAAPIRDAEGKITGGIALFNDITERKRAEEKSKLYRQIFMSSTDGIAIYDCEGKILERNPALVQNSGYHDEELRGKGIASIIGEGELQGIMRRIETTGAYRGETVLFKKDGQKIPIDLSVSPVFDDHGRTICYVGMGRDITDIKCALDELALANRELRDTQTQLVQSEKMASLGMLVAGIAHEINTPVGAIGSMHNTLVRAVKKLKNELGDSCPEQLGEHSCLSAYLRAIEDANRVIETATERVTNIVRRLRSFARLDEAELKIVDIHEGLEDTLLLIHHEIKHNLVLKKDYGELPQIAVYPGRLNQVFLNILNNARQAIKDQGTITITTWTERENVVITITDDGMGIAAETLEKIFDPGFTTKGVGVGTGLGLSICYQIMQDHQGEIKVSSQPGEGTTFTIILPTNLG